MFLKSVEELVALLDWYQFFCFVFFKINIISEVRPEGLSDGPKVGEEMELVMRETKK